MRVLATFLLLLLALPGISQFEEPLFVHYTTRDGLAGDLVKAIVQDDQGFIWIGTHMGLSKFDGRDFVNYNTRTPLQLTSEIITDMEFDSGGRLWVTTTDGINIITTETEEVIHFRFPDLPETTSDNWCIGVERVDERMVVAREKLGFVVFDVNDLSYEDHYLDAYGEAAQDPWNNILQGIFIEEGQDSVVWFSGKSLVRYNLLTDHYDRFRMPGSRAAMRIREKSPDGHFWLGSWGRGIIRFDPETGSFEQVPSPYREGKGLYEGINLFLLRQDSCSMWYSSLERHLGIYNHCTGQFREFQPSQDWYFGLQAERSGMLFEDRSGRIWIGSAQGVACMDPSLQRFANIPGRAFSEISALLGTWTFPIENGRYFHSPQNRDIYFREAITGKVVVVQTPSERMWGGGMFRYGDEIHVHGSDGILELDSVNHILRPGKLQLPDSLIGIVRSLQHLANGDVFAGIDGKGLFRYSHATGSWSRFGLGTERLVPELFVWSDTLLIATTGETAYVHNLNTGGTSDLMDLLQTPTELNFDDVVTMTEDLQGRLWISSDRHPTRVLNRDFSWQFFADSVKATGYYFDQKGRGYLVSNKGFGLVDTEAMTLELLSQQDGLNSNILRNSWSSFVGPYDDGKVIFGLRHGWQVYDPEHHFEEKDFALYLKETVHDGELSEDGIVLEHDYNQLGFEVGMISFSQRHKGQLRYRLNPDLDWIPLSADGRIMLPKLGTGNYQLEVSAINGAGQELTLDPMAIEVLPPFWKTRWFLGLCVLFIAGGIFLFVRQRARRINAKVQLEKEVTESELKSLQAQMNPHFIFNSLNSIKSLIQEQDEDEAIEYLTTFSQLVRGILNASSHQLIPLEQDLVLMDKYIKLESLRFSDSFSYRLEKELDDDAADLLVPPLLCQIYLENAIWHGLMQKQGDRQLTMRITEEGDRLVIFIEDNGIGRKRAAELQSKSALKEKSVGMELAKSRLDSLGRILNETIEVTVTDLMDDLGKPCGTRVRIDLPKLD